MQKLTITAKNTGEDNFITFKGNLDIISGVKNGDTVYANYQKGKVTYSMKVVDKHTGTIRSGLVVIQR